MNITENHAELFKAMAAAQGEFTTVAKDKDNPFYKSKYAPLDSIIEMVRPVLAKHGLSVMQFTDLPDTGEGVLIETIITHLSGEYISGKLYMPAAKLDPQGFGSAITYGRRYALAAALGIVSDEDNDGQGIKGKDRLTPKPASETPKSGAQAAQSAGEGDCLSEAQRSLMAELGGYCNGNHERMAEVLKEMSYYQKADGKEGWLKLDDLRKKCEVAGVQKWIGSTLGKLRKKVADEDIPDLCPECQTPKVNGACRNTACPEGKPE